MLCFRLCLRSHFFAPGRSMSGLPEGVVGVQGQALYPADLRHLAWVLLHLRRSEPEGEALASVVA